MTCFTGVATCSDSAIPKARRNRRGVLQGRADYFVGAERTEHEARGARIDADFHGCRLHACQKPVCRRRPMTDVHVATGGREIVLREAAQPNTMEREVQSPHERNRRDTWHRVGGRHGRQRSRQESAVAHAAARRNGRPRIGLSSA